MFGSFTTGEGDEFSDIEFAVFIEDEALEGFDQGAWLNAVSPVAAYFLDDFGHRTALFENGIRGEFHFLRGSEIPVISTWKGYGWFPTLEAAVMLDRSGALSATTYRPGVGHRFLFMRGIGDRSVLLLEKILKLRRRRARCRGSNQTLYFCNTRSLPLARRLSTALWGSG